MATFIKTGLWEKTKKGFKGWLNLDEVILSTINNNSLIKSMTYSQLLSTITNSGLNKGDVVLITDYQTIHTIDGTSSINTGDLEPIIVTAISVNTLSPIAYSTIYSDDVLYYQVINDTQLVPGCTKGFIYRRIDTLQRNDFPFDFRVMKFRRYQISVETVYAADVEYNVKNLVLEPDTNNIYVSLKNENIGNLLTDLTAWRKFEWANLSYVSTSPINWNVGALSIHCTSDYQDYKMYASDTYYTTSFDNYIAGYNKYAGGINKSNIPFNCNNVIYGASFIGNTIGEKFGGNSIEANFIANNIKYKFRNNSFGITFSYNNVGQDSSDNSFGAGITHCNFGKSFQLNSLGNYSHNNIFEDICASNSFGDVIAYNHFGANYRENIHLSNFIDNVILPNINSFENSITPLDFSSATYVYGEFNCELFKKEDGVIALRYCDSLDEIKIVSAES